MAQRRGQKRRLIWSLVILGISFAGLPPCLLGQTSRIDLPRRGVDSTFFIDGTVVDQKGQPFPHARVVLSFLGTEGQKPIVTDSDGRFYFSRLSEGTYTLTVTAAGYLAVREEIPLQTTSRTLRIRMTPSGESEEDTVTPGSSPTISTSMLKVPEKAVKLYRKGLKEHASRKYSEAAEQFSRAIEIYPGFAAAYSALGVTLLQERKTTEALAAFGKAVDNDPRSFDAHLGLGLVYNDMKDFSKSRVHLSRALELNAGGWQVHYELGRAYFGSAEYGKAEECFKKAKTFRPPYGQLYLLLINSYLQQQRPREALAEMEEFIQNFPDSPFAEQVRTRMVTLREHVPSE